MPRTFRPSPGWQLISPPPGCTIQTFGPPRYNRVEHEITFTGAGSWSIIVMDESYEYACNFARHFQNLYLWKPTVANKAA